MPERLKSTSFNVHPKAHIVIDTQLCNGCQSRACVWACPAELFVAKSDGGILFNYENCLECGTCYVVCEEEGAITWSYPPGGFGVVFYLG
ncbi:MAG: 4Fe-4S dicluster domain-containing protein [Acidimicrobiaceae bacterium]|nr:4Fe-4S dicluster domain-containing protein [Acidimicrobiaceae bacterium]